MHVRIASSEKGVFLGPKILDVNRLQGHKNSEDISVVEILYGGHGGNNVGGQEIIARNGLTVVEIRITIVDNVEAMTARGLNMKANEVFYSKHALGIIDYFRLNTVDYFNVMTNTKDIDIGVSVINNMSEMAKARDTFPNNVACEGNKAGGNINGIDFVGLEIRVKQKRRLCSKKIKI